MKALKLIDDWIDKFSSSVLVISIFLMLFFSLLTIVFRWVNISFPWFESLVRHLVFLSAFLGGVLATGRKSHIGIDILGKYLENRGRHDLNVYVGRVIAVISFGTLVCLAIAAVEFMKVELQYGKPVFLGIHSGFLVGIIPFGFYLLAYRFFYLFVSSFLSEEVKKEEVSC